MNFHLQALIDAGFVVHTLVDEQSGHAELSLFRKGADELSEALDREVVGDMGMRWAAFDRSLQEAAEGSEIGLALRRLAVNEIGLSRLQALIEKRAVGGFAKEASDHADPIKKETL